MSEIFLKIFNMSLAASCLIITVFIIRFILRKSSKRLQFFLWILVAVRLAIPNLIEKAWSFIPVAERVDNLGSGNLSNVESGSALTYSLVKDYLGEAYMHRYEGTVIPPFHLTENLLYILAIVWLVGAFIMLLYEAYGYVNIRIKIRASICRKDNIYVCDEIDSPFVFGLVKPVIYIPGNLAENTLDSVLLHEKMHIRYRDYIWKNIAYLFLCVYWFSPFVWWAYWMFCKDIEMRCDEAVIRKMEREKKASYSQAMLDCSMPKRMIYSPLSFGEIDVKDRVKYVLNYKKPKKRFIACICVVYAVMTFGFLTNPISNVCAKKGVVQVDSSIHTQAEINSAIQVVENKFNRNGEMRGCTLLEIKYAGDQEVTECVESMHVEGEENVDTRDIIVLESTFDAEGLSDFAEGEASHREYGYGWTLKKTSDGRWKIINNGYA